MLFFPKFHNRLSRVLPHFCFSFTCFHFGVLLWLRKTPHNHSYTPPPHKTAPPVILSFKEAGHDRASSNFFHVGILKGFGFSGRYLRIVLSGKVSMFHDGTREDKRGLALFKFEFVASPNSGVKKLNSCIVGSNICVKYANKKNKNLRGKKN